MSSKILVKDIKKGDEYTFLGGSQNASYYVALEDWRPGGHSRDFVSSSGNRGRSTNESARPDKDCTLLNRYVTPKEITNAEIKKGDKLTYIPGTNLNYYVAESDYDNGVTLRLVSKDGHEYESYPYSAAQVQPDYTVTLLERTSDTNNAQEGSDTMNTDDTAVQEAKLDLANDFELSIKFNYTNQRGETADRRLRVENYDGTFVGGQSYDANGDPEGYRHFDVSRINDKIVLR